MTANVKQYAMSMADTLGVMPLCQEIITEWCQDLENDKLGMIAIDEYVNCDLAHTIPLLQKPAGEALNSAVREMQEKGLPRHGPPRLIHALRLLPQQYCVFQWYLRRLRTKAMQSAPPGASPHENGIAIDIHDYEAWIPLLTRHHWRWHGPDLPTRFYFTGQQNPVFANEAVRAFQRLWNVHNPNYPVVVDGHYTPLTAAALEASPIGGWHKGVN